jgi:hypothetical protein
MLNLRFLFIFFIFLFSCTKASKEDTPINPDNKAVDPKTLSQITWIDSFFYNTQGSAFKVTKAKLSQGGTAESLPINYSLANSPLSIFSGAAAPISFLAFEMYQLVI